VHKPDKDQVIDAFVLTAVGKKGILINIIREEAKATVMGDFSVPKNRLAVFMMLVEFLGRSIEVVNIYGISPPGRMQFEPVEIAVAAVKKGRLLARAQVGLKQVSQIVHSNMEIAYGSIWFDIIPEEVN